MEAVNEFVGSPTGNRTIAAIHGSLETMRMEVEDWSHGIGLIIGPHRNVLDKHIFHPHVMHDIHARNHDYLMHTRTGIRCKYEREKGRLTKRDEFLSDKS